jgi:hypothetical protein
MFKTIILSSVISFFVLTQKKCGTSMVKEACYKGRLEIKAICSNYTIKILEGSVDTTKIAANWTDENTAKTYSNVFALGNPCSFPSDLQQGEEFYFTIKEETDKDCMVCQAYYPVPPKRLAIAVLKTPCP